MAQKTLEKEQGVKVKMDLEKKKREVQGTEKTDHSKLEETLATICQTTSNDHEKLSCLDNVSGIALSIYLFV